jgi:hypothetical protein
MTDRALIIGIDHYKIKAWELRAAVRDALAFAEWVTAPGAGRAAKKTLTLLLSPHPDRPVKGFKSKKATQLNIKRALLDHKANGAGAQRLWFFYAGHSIAPDGGGPDEAPVLVPEDVTDLDVYRAWPIDLYSWIREMQVCSPPEHQVYFIDSCRGIVDNEDVVTRRTTLSFDQSKVDPNAIARQAILFATTAYRRANEQGLHGLFGGALIDGLQGKAELRDDAANQDFKLTFGDLADYTKRRIRSKFVEARRAGKELPTQEPEPILLRAQSSLVLARFPDKPRSVVKVFVEPEDATKFGTAGIRVYNNLEGVWERKAEKSPPLAVPIQWKLPSAVHQIEIEARGYKNWSETVTVMGPLIVRRAKLVPTPKTSRDRGKPPGRPDGSGLEAGKQGELVVQARDPHTRIEVFDVAGKRVEAAWERLDKTLPEGPYRVELRGGPYRVELPVGSYRVEIALPTERSIVQSVLVTADEPEVIEVQPDPQLTQRLGKLAGMKKIHPHDGVSVPSEMFGVSTTTHLGSLLAWAASAAQFPPNDNGFLSCAHSASSLSRRSRGSASSAFWSAMRARPGRIPRADRSRRCSSA